MSNRNPPLREQKWFHGVLEREEVERLLVKQGDYLIWEHGSKKNGKQRFILSVMWREQRHFVIQGEPETWLPEVDNCATLEGLLLKLANIRLPVIKKSKASLVKPVVRDHPEPQTDDTQLYENIGQITKNPIQPLNGEEWFHGVLSRESTKQLLVEKGDYLIRESKNKKTGKLQYVLSVMWERDMHFIIKGEPGSWHLEGANCATIQQLVLKLQRSGLPVTNNSKALLINAVVRDHPGLQTDDTMRYENIGQRITNNPILPFLSRESTKQLLAEEGDYLIRKSKNEKTGQLQYVLSVMWERDMHFIIKGQPGRWCLFEGHTCATIQELILKQHMRRESVTYKSNVILKNPIFPEQLGLQNDDIELHERIGQGLFGDVFRGTYNKTIEVAVKICRETLPEDTRKTLFREVRILTKYDHPNIVRVISIAAQSNPIMLVMEYVAGGDLRRFLRKQDYIMTSTEMLRLCGDVATGMAYLESKNCIHRDLVARNCLVGEANIVKIADFGIVQVNEEYIVSGLLNKIPIKWTAPEVIHFGRYTSLSDVWSFGVLMWEVFSGGKTPYPGMNNTTTREKVDEGYRMPSPEGIPDKAYQLMLQCWDYNPEKRPHFEQIKEELERLRKIF